VILEEYTNLFCWKRTPDPIIQQYLEKVLQIEPKPIHLKVSAGQVSEQLKEARESWEKMTASLADNFWMDVERLVEDFLKLCNSETAVVHLKVISDNACTKFHTDGYSLRLFTTYLGKGTEWLPEIATNRTGLGRSNELIIKDASKIQQMESFEVGVLKGEPAKRPRKVNGIVHRSPEIMCLNEKRIILRVDI
jgi:hypothetical protein